MLNENVGMFRFFVCLLLFAVGLYYFLWQTMAGVNIVCCDWRFEVRHEMQTLSLLMLVITCFVCRVQYCSIKIIGSHGAWAMLLSIVLESRDFFAICSFLLLCSHHYGG
ncbi:hypothetical protein Droror1_Dr00015527 [Drosera rotundifolia]